jgi:hypothetical protein
MGAVPRRHRLLAWTAGLGALFVASAAVAVWIATRPAPIYRPGEGVQGLTADLARELPPDYPRVTFTDVSAEAGIHFRHFAGRRTSQLPEDMGSGAAWGDYDNDEWLDLYVVNEVGPVSAATPEDIARSPAHAALYRNLGDGTFREVSAEAGVQFRGWGMGAAWADYDNDGRLDIFVSTYGENVLYRNNGDGTFTDRTAAAGMSGHRGFWAGACWGDYDRDGFLDLYVAGYVHYRQLSSEGPTRQYDVEQPAGINPSSFEPLANLLFRNNGNGTFTEVAARAGVANPMGRSLSAVWADFDDDGWPDLYVANDVSDNALYRNQHDGTFTDVSLEARVADYRGAMGLAVGDWDGDEDLDIFITHWLAQENALYSNRATELKARGAYLRPLQFTDEADRYGLGQIALDFVGWGTSFFDYDNDARPDLLVVNGSTLEVKDDPRLLVPMRSLLFWNRGTSDGFFDVSSVSGPYFAEQYVGRGAAFGDYDRDGDVDVFVVNNGGPGILLRNDGGNRNRWLEVGLEGARSNRRGIGARLRLVAGGTVQVREVGAQSSYLSQNSVVEHFGLGALAAADTLEIRWPSGAHQIVLGPASNQILRISETGAQQAATAKRP